MHTLNIGILAHVDAGRDQPHRAAAVRRRRPRPARQRRRGRHPHRRRRDRAPARDHHPLGRRRLHRGRRPDQPDRHPWALRLHRRGRAGPGGPGRRRAAALRRGGRPGTDPRAHEDPATTPAARARVRRQDRTGAREEALLDDVRRRLTPYVVPLTRVRDIGGPHARVIPRPLDETAVGTLAEVDTEVPVRVVDGPVPTPDLLDAALTARTADGSLHPVLFGSALGGQGVPELVEALVRTVPRTAAPDSGQPRGTVFAVRPGPGGERTAYLRLYEGRVTSRQRLTFMRREADGRTCMVPGRARELEVVGRPGAVALTAGDIAALRGVSGVRVGDRLGEVTGRAPRFAAPTLETVVRAKDPHQAAAPRPALLALADQDPLLRARPAPSGATSLLLYGEVQLEVLSATLARDFGIEAEFEPSRVRLLERPDGTGEAYEEIQRHGHLGFWATVGLRIGPGPLGSGGVFTYETELGALPRAFHQAIEDTVHITLLTGTHGRPVTDCRVTLTRSGFGAPLSTAADFRGLTPIVPRRALERARTRAATPSKWRSRSTRWLP